MGRSIGIISVKGGVGKTTVAAALATDLANHYHQKVLLIDANYGAPNLGLHMNTPDDGKTIHHVLAGKGHLRQAIQRRYGVDVIAGDSSWEAPLPFLKLRDRLAHIKDQYDFVILDGSPHLNDELLSTILASDSLFVVSTPDEPTLQCSLRAAALAKQRGKPITGMIINKIRDPSYELSLDDLETATGIPVVARIPDEKFPTRALFTRIPLSLYKRNSKFAREIHELGGVLTHRAKKPSFFRSFLPKSFKKEEVNRELVKERLYVSAFTKDEF